MNTLATARPVHLLPALPYAPEALEPHIDARTMALHHDKHHASYVENLNTGLANHPKLQERSAIWILLNATAIPADARTAICNNAGGHVNHSMLWRMMAPGGSSEPGSNKPGGALADALARDFGGLEKFKARFEEAGAKAFGSGWVWLVRTEQDGGRLVILTTAGHGNPLVNGHFPLLVNDVWEHAYYLKHQNRRADYLNGWWPVVDWNEVARRLESSTLPAAQRWLADGGLALEAA